MTLRRSECVCAVEMRRNNKRERLLTVANLVPSTSFPWQVVGKQELWEHPFGNNKGK